MDASQMRQDQPTLQQMALPTRRRSTCRRTRSMGSKAAIMEREGHAHSILVQMAREGHVVSRITVWLGVDTPPTRCSSSRRSDQGPRGHGGLMFLPWLGFGKD